MRHALALARTVMYTTTPNPRVGCVIVRDGRVIGEGATQPPGGAHAEVGALRDAARRGESTAGATFYVTLEPCSHYGRTPPCADAVVAAAPARVVVAMGDPNPLVAGAGLARLRDAGIAVTAGICQEEALALNAGFAARMSRGTPWTWLKLAASLDGRSALHNGMSQWITGAEARADGHAWRARADVILTGMGTVLKDDPQLTVRDFDLPRQPRKAVVDSELRLPENARLLDGSEVWVFTTSDDQEKARRLEQRNARVIRLPAAGGDAADGAPAASASDGRASAGRAFPGRVDLAAMLRWMGEQQVNEVHVEAGAGLSGALLAADCVDEVLAYIAPVLLGDAAGMVGLPMLEHLKEARRFEFIDVARLGGDVRLRGRYMERWQQLMTAAAAS
ncbi:MULTISPECIES: bifunctional diaminohydroxyphosphoribosylaminopyrimidine deaminase/5-amino-6-(5-phosphoribosylamino)uracil reductase RibD [unclassified Achromobacter]|uniref:bifunctional diaminohydroxyphosphoribosylaminopyrimidine deaminase/5-amino-6-(5-phosphoribosylamino)uracil reductase RibD n=1 Tax=unclassified Achromobacter TaxID=2626865 RepID=UPI000B518746|nr:MULTISPECIES: bifunctional diaminohydroxyphosphoribosylaminopyrimidine deaminase/5-amino-6-(5-phosphoribosylamino)uracil reductase RibD [unclassified Achromobacter]OWT75869.1 riboflavin biosynthesis protein RibD [Achromobacter sp. HZ28]OWT76719.1 riboflavin biosynthesis protein RibD [Achromobacter sp. HZ34]